MRPRIPRGFRDIPPEIMSYRLRIMDEIREVFLEYGFPPMQTPSIEFWETLKGKYGEEAEGKLIWRFQDPYSGRMYALRYDLTVPLARYVAMHPELSMPFKRQQIGLVWRHEEPQRNRYREFVQADIDTVGSPFIEADAEIINAISRALDRIGIKEHSIRINHRELLRKFFEEKIGVREPIKVYRVIDKLDKIGIEGVYRELLSLGIGESKAENIRDLLLEAEKKDAFNKLDNIFEGIRGGESVKRELETLYDLLENPSKAKLDLSLVRGLDYYTGVIFEYSAEEHGGASIAGGGRYDNLIGLFREGESLPATGGSIGFERVMNIILEKKGTGLSENRLVYIVSHGKRAWRKAWSLASQLRERRIPVEVDLMRRTPSKQRKRAQAIGARFLIFIGEKELESGKIVLYDRVKSTRIEESLEVVLKTIEETKN